jgi:superfamily II DNA or RNA helicase
MSTLEFDGALARFTDLDPEMRSRIEAELTFTNRALAYEAKSLHRNIESRFCLFAEDCFPTGLLQRVVTKFSSMGLKINGRNLHPIVNPSVVELPEYLRDYQVTAISKMIENLRGLVEMPTASGKTLTAIWYLKHFPNARILFTVPSVDLLEQTYCTFSEAFNEPIGRLGNGHGDWQRITIGVINSLVALATSREPKLQGVQICIHDEAHSAGSNSYLTLAITLTTQSRVMGLSATPERNDGADLIVEGVCGPTIYKVSPQQVAKCGGIILPDYYQIELPDRYKVERRNPPLIPKAPSHLEILKLYKYAITTNAARTKTIVDLVLELQKLTSRQGNILILFDYRDHGEAIQLELERRGVTAPLVDGKTKKKQRTQIIDAFTTGETEVLIGSSILKQGVDFPELEFLILAGSRSAEGLTWQQVGRALRANASYQKARSVIIDFRDGDYFFRRRAERRFEANQLKYGYTCCKILPSVTKLIELL